MANKRPYHITQDDPNITVLTSFGTGWDDAWEWECPDNMRILIEDGNLFSAELYDSADAEYVGPDAEVQIVVRDASDHEIMRIFGPDNYCRVTEWQSFKSRAKLRLEQPVVVEPGSKIVVRTKDSTGMDTASIANSQFILETSRIVD